MPRDKRHEVVISGMSGIYPESDDVDELWRRLLNKEDMVTIDGRRWVPGEFDVPPGTGKVKNPEKFDMTFFGIHRKLCEKMDPYTRLLCEQAYRAVCDAGVNPRYLDGSNTAVIMASFSSEPENDMGASLHNQGTYNILAFSRTMQANRLSYFLNLKGPSFQLDCSGCGGVQAIQYACDLISTGVCAAAIVGTCHLLNKPEPSFHYQVLGRLSEDSVTRSFSADADGYARSETCATFFLQRKENANRIYGTILSARVLCHGSKDQPFTEFPLTQYDQFLLDTYKNANVDPRDLAYLEAYGAASKTLDALELNALSRTLLKGRKEPLLIGSIKTNIGHTEGSSAMASLTKVLLALDRGIIPPNISYTGPNPDVPDLVSGKLKVVTEPTPLNGDIAGICELSFTGVCGHIILKRCEKFKAVKDSSKDGTELKRLPFLAMMSGRNDEVLAHNMKTLESSGVDEEFIILLNSLYREGIKSHVYRGYTVISDAPNSYNMVGPAPSGEKRPIWFMYSGMGSQWPMMAKALMDLPIFAQAIHKCHAVLAPKGVNLLEIVTKDDASMFEIILNSFVGIAAVQIGLTDILRAVGISPDGIIGHSVGELGCAYADGCMTAEQMILAAHARGKASVEAVLTKGMMAAVGLGYNAIKDKIPPSIEVACHNSKESCTLSGPAEDMATYIAQLKAKGIFAKLVNVANIAYHSRYIKPAAPALLKYLKEILPVPVKRSTKWVSSSNLEENWNTDLAQHSSAEYHTNNLLSSVLFEEASAHVPSNAIVIEIAPHGLLQAIVKRSLPQAVHIPLTSRFDPNNLMYLLGALGKMYLAGIPVDLRALYPSASFPVGRGTPAISPLIDWLRDENFIIRRSLCDNDSPSPLCKFISIKKGDKDFEQLASHKINKRIILPSNLYFTNIIEIFTNIGSNDGMPLILEDFKFPAYAEVLYNSTTEIRIQLMQGTGNVVINKCDDGEIVLQGKINITDVASVKDINSPEVAVPQTGSISRQNMVGFMKSMGVEKEESQVQIDNIFLGEHDAIATAKWSGSLGDFLTSVLSLVEFYETRKYNVLKLIYKVGEMKINYPLLQSAQKELLVHYDAANKSLLCEGMKISFISCKHSGLCRAKDKDFFFAFEFPNFVPYVNNDSLSFKDLVTISTQLVLENTVLAHDTTVKITEIGQNNELRDALRDISDSMKYSGCTQITTFETEQGFAEQGSSVLLQKDVFLIFTTPPSEDVLKSLVIINNGFVLMPKSQNEQIVNNHSKVIFESKVNGLWYTLYSISNKNYKRQYEVVNLNDSGYIGFLENQLTKAGELNVADDSKPVKTIILWGEVDSMVTVDNIIEETKHLPNYHLLHYWLFYGTSPDFNSGDVDFKNQIQRDVKMNISMGGTWGSLRLLPTNFNDGCMEATSQPTKFYYPLSAVLVSHKLQALGLNLHDNLTDGASAELGAYDYVSSTGLGIGSYDPDTKTFNADSILSWPKPSRWTPEEAATVPVLYSLASYIIHHSNNGEYTNDRTILVNRALLPLSQAVIALALHENMTVYASVYGDDEKRVLQELFPKLKAQNIYDCSTVAFFVDVIKNTNGVYKVINNFDDTHMIGPCARCVKPLGVLIYISQTLMSSAYMGMLKFNEEIIARGASSDVLLKSSDNVKMEIRKNVQDAISKGAVVPLSTVTVLPLSTLHNDAVQTVQVSSKKVVVSSRDSKIAKGNKIYLEDESKIHVIVEGKIHIDVSLDILEWLLKRGSRKVVVFMGQSHPFEATSLRLQSLRDHYRWAEIDVRSSNHLSSKTNIMKFVEEYSSSALENIFFLGSGLREKIEQFDEILSSKIPNCNMICIGKGGENVCERRKKNALPSLYIRCSTSTLECVDLSQYLDNLIKDSSRVPVVLVNKCTIHSSTLHGLMANLMHIPDTKAELQDLMKQCTPRATFEEIITASPGKKFSREVYPMFLIPGLRPKRLHRMASQLYCPAFEARLPSGVTDLDQLANDLTQQLLSLPQNVFTLVADDWGGILALHVAAKLESFSKMATVILLNATPASIFKWANGLLKDEVALIGKYLTVSSDVKPSAKNSNWDETLRVAIENSGLKTYEDKKLSRDGLNLLWNRLKAVVSSKPPLNKIKTKCHVVEITDQAFEEHGLKEYLKKDPILHLKEVKSVTEMIDTAVAEDVNSLLMIEYKDAANPPIEEYIGMNIVKKPTWMSSLLYRVRE